MALISGLCVPLTSERGCRMVVPLFMRLVLTLQTFFFYFFSLGLIVPRGLKQPHLGWPMTSVSVHLQLFCWSCSTGVCDTPALSWTVLLLTCVLMCSPSLDLSPGMCLESRARAAHQPALLPGWGHEVALVLWSQGSSQSSMCSKTLCG